MECDADLGASQHTTGVGEGGGGDGIGGAFPAVPLYYVRKSVSERTLFYFRHSSSMFWLMRMAQKLGPHMVQNLSSVSLDPTRPAR